jgi:hypothetical protein
MKAQRLGRCLALLALTVLVLAACQPAALEISAPPEQPSGAATQPAVATVKVTVSEPTPAVSQDTPAAEGTVLPAVDGQLQEGWLVLADDSGGYSLAFPPEWKVCQETRYSWTFCDLQEDPAWMGSPLRLYVSVFPSDSTNADWEVYNFIPTATIREFMELPVGESRSKVPGSPRPEYSTYTRLPDQVVAGSPALVIENAHLWGIPPGTKERVVLMVAGDRTYLLGMYYETTGQLALFEQVLDSFQFHP